jgi:plastocyanin domain-containing protein
VTLIEGSSTGAMTTIEIGRATLTSSDHREVMMLVKGGYTPDEIPLMRGKPARSNFRREVGA